MVMCKRIMAVASIGAFVLFILGELLGAAILVGLTIGVIKLDRIVRGDDSDNG